MHNISKVIQYKIVFNKIRFFESIKISKLSQYHNLKNISYIKEIYSNPKAFIQNPNKSENKGWTRSVSSIFYKGRKIDNTHN
jgi:hypothetical protein